MKNQSSLVKMKLVTYNDKYLRLIAALFSAHLIVAYGENETFAELLKLQAYYMALGPSFLIALILVEGIYRFTCYFDKQFPWERSIVRRSFIQITGGILIPLILDCTLAAAYFKFYGTDLITAGYFRYNFTIIILLIILFNAYYLIHYMVKLKLKRRPRFIKNEIKTAPFEDDDFPILILIQDGVCLSVNKEDKVSYHNRTLEQIYNDLSADRYFLINRAFIVERSAIGRMIPGRSRTIKLDIKSKRYPTAQVSQRNSVAFKEWVALN